MKISIEHFAGKYPQFNVSLASAEGKEPFLVVKGCRIVDGSNGPFVSWPATKNQSTGKYWNHCHASDGFAAAVLKEAQDTMPREPVKQTRGQQRGRDGDMDDDIPF